MPKRIIFEENGQLKVVIPAPDFISRGGTLSDIIAKVIPQGISHQIIDTTNVLSDRTFRNAWKAGTEKIEVDMPKARLIHMESIRKERNKELEASDKELAKELETGPASKNLKDRRQALRDLPATFDLSLATTPEELKALWPSNLPRS